MAANKNKIKQEKIIEAVSSLSGLSREKCRIVLNDYFYVIRLAMLNGMEVELKGLGVFKLRYKPAKESRLMPDVTKGGEMNWTAPKEEYNYPYFSPYQSFVQKMRSVTEGHAFKPNDESRNSNYAISPEEYDEFSKRLDELGFDEDEFDDDEFEGMAKVEREVDYGRLCR